MTLTDTLLAQIAQKAAMARTVQSYLRDRDQIEVKLTRYEGDESYSKIVRPYDPARVLAECERDRRLVELHRPSDERNRWCNYCKGTEHAEYPCETLRILALPETTEVT